jgi:hypothetical protein
MRTRPDKRSGRSGPAAALAGGSLLVASQWQDITRYLKIKRMPAGQGHLENVPASGSRRYPSPGQGAPDGAGAFDSAMRGGPADS